jgi:hypothetical protein
MIPVIGTAVVFDTYWVSKLLASVDFPVENFLIINNNGKGEITEDLDRIAKIKHKFIKNIHVCHMPANMGVSCSWNLMIKSYIMAPYWVIVNDDVSFDSSDDGMNGIASDYFTKPPVSPKSSASKSPKAAQTWVRHKEL